MEAPTFSVVAETHFRLAKANGVFALRHSIEFLELGLVYTLQSSISKEFHGL